MNDENTFELSRRSVLAGLGTVGIASAGAGLGTSAYFSDTETFEGNSITAGTLDLKVDWQQAYYGASESLQAVNAYPDANGDGVQDPLGEVPCVNLASGDNLPAGVFSSPNRSAEDGGPIVEQGSLVHLDDVKPGDWGEITFSLHICDNPGYLWFTGGGLEEAENGETEPESQVDETEGGDLADEILITAWYDDDCDNVLDTEIIDGEDGEATEVVSEHVIVDQQPLSAVMAELSGMEKGYPLDADPSTEGRQPFAGAETHCVAVKWELPFEVGNHVQSDSVAVDFGFYAEQARHNDGTGNATGNASTASPPE